MSAKIIAALEHLGFSEWMTGGGCTAMGLNLADAGMARADVDHIMVTRDEDASVPVDDDAVVIGLYAESGAFMTFRFATPDQAIGWLKMTLVGIAGTAHITGVTR